MKCIVLNPKSFLCEKPASFSIQGSGYCKTHAWAVMREQKRLGISWYLKTPVEQES